MTNHDTIIPYPVMESPFTLVESPPPPRWETSDLPHVNAALSAARSDVARLREKRRELEDQLNVLTHRFAATSTEIGALDRVVRALESLFMEGGNPTEGGEA
jgi:hypothetical protein